MYFGRNYRLFGGNGCPYLQDRTDFDLIYYSSVIYVRTICIQFFLTVGKKVLCETEN